MTDFEQSAFVGKTIKAASYTYEQECDDLLKIEFTDGSAVQIQGLSCNNDTAALLFVYPVNPLRG